jgi:glycosyltransferase involved in cell wall biosynthesis
VSLAPLATAFRVLRGEGVLAVRDRTLDRLAESRRRRSFRPAGEGWTAACPVLVVSAHPPEPRFGGVQAQWHSRLAAEEALGPVARLYPDAADAGGYRLEVATGPGGERRALRRPAPPLSARAFRDPGFEGAVAWAAARVGARVLHVEGAAGLPPESLLALAQGGPGLLLSLHDFALFCSRPHLLEEPCRRFCSYCRDLDRCAACLQEEPEFQRRWREAGGALLAAAAAVVFPSTFLERAYIDLFGPLPGGSRVIPPALPPPGPLPAQPPAGPFRHLALVGGVQPHKGAEIFIDVVERLAAGRPDLTWSAYGGGDPALLARLRGTGRVRVRGYYRAGSLPALLRRDRVDLALLPSIVPESFSLVLSECRAAGVPVLAFDLGAVGERLRQGGGGLVVPLEEGAAGFAALAAAVVSGERTVPILANLEQAEPGEAAKRWRDLYRELFDIR